MTVTPVAATQRVATRFRQAFTRGPPSSSLTLGLGAITGLGTGIATAALVALIGFVERIAFGSDPGWLLILTVPAAGAFLVGLVVTYWAPEDGGSGINETMRTIYMRGSRFRGRAPFGGLAASGVALGTGNSGGPEGPIVLIGGSIGSLLGRLFALTEERKRTLVAAGVAAGIGAVFNAPIGGMLFALELIVISFRGRTLQVVVLASVVGSVTANQFLESKVIYEPATVYQLNSPGELALYALLGLVAVAAGLGFLHGDNYAKRFFNSLRVWKPLRLAMAGLVVGLIALVLPEVLGTGDSLPVPGAREPIQAMIDGEFAVGYAAAGALLALSIAKLVATCVTVGSGNAVGTFTPALFVGAALGGSLGHTAEQLIPGAGIEPGAFALVGMAAVFAAAARAPLTAIVVIVEITQDYQMVLPLMLAVGIATFVAGRFNPYSVYTAPLKEEGIVYGQPDDVDIMEAVTVGEVMTTSPDTVAADLPVDQLRAEFQRTHHHGFPVVRGDTLVGIVTVSDLAKGEGTAADNGEAVTAGEIATPEPETATVTAEDPVFLALERMGAREVGRLPVVDRTDHCRLAGLIRRQDIVKAYQQAVSRRAEDEQARESTRLRDLPGVHFVDFVVGEDAPVDGEQIRNVTWPSSTTLACVRRNGHTLSAGGDTGLSAGDVVTVVTPNETTETVRRLIAGSTTADDST
jgi:CIC family chloride channel protein